MNENTPVPLVLSPALLPEVKLARSLRLVAVGSAPVLLASKTHSESAPHRTDIWALPLAGKGPSGAVATVPQLLPAPPRWDARAADNGTLTFVLELAGGAMNALIQSDGTPDQRSSLTAHHPFGSFSGPRFVRGAPGSAAVSAVLDNATGVVISGATEQPIGPCIDVVVIANGAGSAPGASAVCKRVAPGAARGDALPGTVRVQPLDASYRPAGADALPFGDRTVFEVDADRAGAGLLIVATTGARLLVAHSPSSGAAFRILQVDAGGADPQTFSAPCVVVSGATATIAVLAKAGTPDARALTASWPLDAPP